MQSVLDFLRDNAAWLFGGGGVAAIVLEALKRGGDTKSSITVTGSVGGDVVGRDKITHAGPGPWGVLQMIALLVCVIGAAAWLWARAH